MATKMGFEGVLYYGAAGSTAATQITNRRDVNYTIDNEKGDTTIAGAGSTPPIKTARVTAIVLSIEWTMLNRTDDTTLTALRTAAAAGTAVAIRTKDYSSGKGFDGDVILSQKDGMPIAGEQTFVFTAEPTDENRTPQAYV
jgi:hypothetical protein